MPRTAGRIHRDGLTATATVLVEALEAAQKDKETAETLTHPFHTYPARLHPATAKVLVEARANGLRTIGTDLNPLATLVARAKTWTVPPRKRHQLRELGHSIAGASMAAGKAARRSGAEAAPLRRPAG